MKETLNTNRIAMAAVAMVCTGFIGMSYAAGQTIAPVTLRPPARVIDLRDIDLTEPTDDNLAEKAREVAKVVQEMVREAEKRRVQAPRGGSGGITFPGIF